MRRQCTLLNIDQLEQGGQPAAWMPQATWAASLCGVWQIGEAAHLQAIGTFAIGQVAESRASDPAGQEAES